MDKASAKINKNKTRRRLHSLIVLLLDIAILTLGACLGPAIRNGLGAYPVNGDFWLALLIWFPIYLVASILVFSFFKMYRFLWHYIGIRELFTIVTAISLSGVIFTAAAVIIAVVSGFASVFSMIAVCIVAYIFDMVFIIIMRFVPRMRDMVKVRTRADHSKVQNTMIIGAGGAASLIIQDMLNSENIRMKPCCIIDDNPGKQNRCYCGIPIVGGRNDIPRFAVKYDIKVIAFCIASISPTDKKEILEICTSTGCEVKVVPTLSQIVNNEVSVSKMQPVDILDLLGRSVIKQDLESVRAELQGKVVMITGGGGSIGSEICRQVAQFDIKRLIIVDIYENNAYSIQQELKRNCPELDLVTLIASVRDRERLEDIFDKYSPDIVYHAAAHKHVPLMEDSPNEAIKNNVFGTKNVAECADKYGVARFVMISTDKAVNPTNIMGASKRLCEMVVQNISRHSKTCFTAVRFGNVLGSNGSVIPLFKKQIAAGGPVTVTDPRIIRYFMTIPEAVSLVLQSGCSAKNGEIFILDMGEPVKIDDLARKLIRLSGFTPGVDMKIEYTGLRPGEKLYEELLMDEEGLTKTDNELIFIGKPIEIDEQQFEKTLDELYEACCHNSKDIIGLVEKAVPTYHPKRN
ncbi:MAG: nucleoside-diphosphate sugar epimerase/dehydratase [Firmicutes bacterium]|nr:nucleoside-diphosphate sugar epimerase/dehydratase [Bacillota bacterium]